MIELIQQGGWVMWPLLFLSLVSVAFMIERFLFFWDLSRNRSPHQLNTILSLAEKGELEKAEKLAGLYQRDFVIRTLLSGLEHRRTSLTQALETQALVETRKMKRYLSVLDTVITSAPMLGILGTVIGIILSFDVLGSAGVSDPMAVTRGISQALITTAFGLSIALLTLVPYNYFLSLYKRGVEDLERYSSIFELIFRKRQNSEEYIH